MEPDDTVEKRARLAAAEDRLARLGERYDLAMSAFKFDEARELRPEIETAERERQTLAESLPPPPAPAAPALRRRPLPLRRRRRH